MTSEDAEMYLAVLTASYDYTPQSEDEIAIKEDQLLLLTEKVDKEWWKVKVKGASQDADGPPGLVPAAYVEQAEHSSVVKVLYDYEACAPGELSVQEDDVLFVFDTEDGWILAQDSKEGGKAGYVPGNYVEVMGEEEPPAPSRIVVPDSPPPPVSTYVDPADRVASTKMTADDIQTWSLSEIDKKGKKKKGTLGIGNGAVFFASEADKTPVQKWQTRDVVTVVSEKSKHVRIDIGGSSPISLHFHCGSKENADSIVAKLHSSKALSSGPTPTPSSAAQDHEDTSERTVSPPLDTHREVKKASVHFSPASPVIIPPAHEEEPEEEEEEEIGDDVPVSGDLVAVALYDFTADGEDELSVVEGERLTILEKDGDEWWKCRNSKGAVGVAPASYLESVNISGNTVRKGPSVDREASAVSPEDIAKDHEAELLRQEQEEREQQQREAAAARKLEAQRKAKESAIAAEAERQRRKDAGAARMSPPPVTQAPRAQEPTKPSAQSPESSSSRTSSDANRAAPDRGKIRIWHDRSGQFRVEAAFLGFNNGKLRLHKVNGVIVEVPSEKMSVEDMRYVERFLDKKNRPPGGPRVSEDDIPLAISKSAAANNRLSTAPVKKAPRIDWFDFFLSAGCDLDDCTRYAASFEKDKIDETILGDITDGTMRSLGLREGDIIRVSKAIEKRKPTDNLAKSSPYLQEQLRRDEELARQLQAQESSPHSRSPAPNLFAGPGGVLKPRRGRPQPSKSLPPSNVDLKAISSASDLIQRTSSPQISSPASAQMTPSATFPPRPNSAVPVQSGFEDDAWTNRPSSTKPLKPMSPAAAPQIPSAPPAAAKSPVPTPTIASPPPQPTPTSVPSLPASQPAPALAKTESDIFEQLARLGELRKASTPVQHPVSAPPPMNMQPPHGYQAGMGMSTSPLPMAQLAALSPPPQPYNGPRGPFAPVLANQTLLQPLIPTQTGFSGFIPTKAANSASPFQNQLAPPPFLSQQQTGFQNPQPMMSQPTGNVFNGYNPMPPFQGTGFAPIQTHTTGFNPGLPPSMYGNTHNGFTPPPPPPVPQIPVNNNSPANVFAQMKSGTFANDNGNAGSGLNGQNPGWGQPYQEYTGYQH
ncbi:hypothetical protein B0H34DRAFT_793770 [Crassisporium funariophilum]|nr:hypothetical protein B0H34DRAFT_793770 [Crassisporium funariophilum]